MPLLIFGGLISLRAKDDVAACRRDEQGQQRDDADRALDPTYAHAEVSHGV